MTGARRLRLLAAGLLVLVSVSPGYVRFLRQPLHESRARFAAMVDGPAPGLSEFLSQVRDRTRPGDAIAIVVPSRDWDRGYSYAYYRAVYLISGRRVIPVVDSRDRILPEKIREATHVAVWGAGFRSDEFVLTWSGSGGALLKRR